jgi:predicted DsbA family dithiol-disulfide isomerase
MARTILDEVLGERVDFIEHQLGQTVKDSNVLFVCMVAVGLDREVKPRALK